MNFTFTENQLLKLSKSDLVQVILTAQKAENGLAPMEEIVGTEVIQEHTWNGPSAVKIIKVNGKKFKLFYEKSNGSPLGFNYKMCASVMDDNGTWKYAFDSSEMPEYDSDVSYVSSESSRKSDAIVFITLLQKRVEKLYA